MKRQRGVALAIVVWFVAGMSLLVAGIVASARVDTRTTQIHLARAKAVAAGDGAIKLAMLERRSGFDVSAAGPLISESRHRLGDIEVLVRIIPASGFVDVNSAPAEVLQALFRFAGGLEPEQAQKVASAVVEWRKGAGGAGEARQRRSRQKQRRFYSLEDMLRVEGVNRTLLDGIREYAVAGSWASGAVDWSAAPQQMLEILAELNPGQAGVVAKRREAMSVNAGRARLAGGVYRADALVTYGGRIWLRRLWLKTESARGSSLPWRDVRTESPRVVGLQQ